MASYADAAKAAGDTVFLPKQSAMEAQQAIARSQALAARASLTGAIDPGNAAIGGAYDHQINDLVRNRNDTNQAFNTTLDSTRDNYQQGLNQGAAAQSSAIEYLNQLAASTGGSFGRGMADAQAPGIQKANDLASIQNQLITGRMSGLQALGQGMDDSNRRAEANAQGAKGQAIAGFNSRLASEIGNVNSQGLQQEQSFMNQLQELMSNRGNFELQWGQGMADRDSQASLEQAKLSQSAQQASAELAMRAQESAQQQSNWEASRGDNAQDNSWEKEKFYASLGLDKDKMAFDQYMALQPGEQEIPNYAGRQGAQLYLQDQGLPSQFLDQFTSAQQGLANDPVNQGADLYSLMLNPQTRYNAMHSGQAGQIPANVWRDLAAITSGNY